MRIAQLTCLAVLALSITAGSLWAQPATLAEEPINATQPSTTRPSQAAVLAANTVLHADVPFGGPDPTLDVLDVYAPADAHGAPVLLFVHGGEWSRGDKKDVSSKPKFLNEHGIIFVATNYRLSPKDRHPAQVNDIASAIAWVHGHIADYGGDPNKIVIMGHSAGCHLVTLVSLDPRYLARVGMKPSDLRGTIAWSGGMYDLVARAHGGGIYPPFINATFGFTPEEQHAGSPMTYVSNASAAPPMLVASIDDPRSQNSREASEELVRQLKANGGNAQATLLVGKTHFNANHELGAPGDESGKQLLEFFNNVTK